MRVLVTGATGFIGRTAIPTLVEAGLEVRACVRAGASFNSPVEAWQVSDLCEAEWEPALKGVDCVLHLAGSAHFVGALSQRQKADAWRTNVDATRRLASCALHAGVSRFVFVSSIGVHGSKTTSPIKAEDRPNPVDFYARTKLEAEREIEAVCRGGMDFVIVRPPLVAGAQAPGNLARMVSLVSRGVPLPVAGIDNRRSLVGVRSLAALLVLCCRHEKARNCVLLAADDPPLSTAEIVSEIARGMGVRCRSFYLPIAMLRSGARMLGRSRDFERLCNSLEVDANTTVAKLGWTSPFLIHEELQALGRSAQRVA